MSSFSRRVVTATVLVPALVLGVFLAATTMGASSQTRLRRRLRGSVSDTTTLRCYEGTSTRRIRACDTSARYCLTYETADAEIVARCATTTEAVTARLDHILQKWAWLDLCATDGCNEARARNDEWTRWSVAEAAATAEGISAEGVSAEEARA
mmetsp:Transcript_27399/g.109748  ORF Transcript_27399/g.109748 Transcript_27399/m.109748 type:complete len:153 (-) Transcript_27399:198-656(-)